MLPGSKVKKVFAKFGNTGWMLRDCSSYATLTPISEFPGALENKHCPVLLPTSPQCTPWWWDEEQHPVLEWPQTRTSKHTFVLSSLWCKHQETQIPLLQLTHLSCPGVSTVGQLSLCSSCPAHTEGLQAVKLLFTQINIWILTGMLTFLHTEICLGNCSKNNWGLY